MYAGNSGPSGDKNMNVRRMEARLPRGATREDQPSDPAVRKETEAPQTPPEECPADSMSLSTNLRPTVTPYTTTGRR